MFLDNCKGALQSSINYQKYQRVFEEGEIYIKEYTLKLSAKSANIQGGIRSPSFNVLRFCGFVSVNFVKLYVQLIHLISQQIACT